MRLFVVLAVLVACDSGPNNTPAAPAIAHPAPAAVKPVLAAPPQPAQPGTPSVEVDSLLMSLPPFERGPRARSNPHLEDSLSLAARGGPASEDGFGTIISASYAVVADPSSAPARFALACSLAVTGLHVEAQLAVRKLVEQNSCPACTDALANVAEGVCGFDAPTAALARTVKPGAVHVAATTVLRALNSGDASSVAPFIDAGTISMRSTCSVCDEDRTTTTRYTGDAFRVYITGADERLARDAHAYNSPVFMFCDARCCSGPTGFLTHSASSVTSICFRGGPDAPKLATIDTLDG